jgi:hypothetical protein
VGAPGFAPSKEKALPSELRCLNYGQEIISFSRNLNDFAQFLIPFFTQTAQNIK